MEASRDLCSDHFDVEDELTDSWVAIELPDGSSSLKICVSSQLGLPDKMKVFDSSQLPADVEQMLQEAQKSSSTSSSLSFEQLSGSYRSPATSDIAENPGLRLDDSDLQRSVSQLDEIDSNLLPSQDKDWVLEWASQPTNQPPRLNQFQHPMTSSHAPLRSQRARRRKRNRLSLRKSQVMRDGFCSWHFLQVFIPTLIVSNLLAFGLGIYVGKRLASPSPNTAGPLTLL